MRNVLKTMFPSPHTESRLCRASECVRLLFKSAYFLCELDGEVDFREEVTKIFARLLRFARDSLSK